MGNVRVTCLAILAIGLSTVFADRQALAQDGPPPPLGITIDSSTLIPTPDPQWQIDFSVSLTPGCTLTSGSYLTISNIALADGVTLVSSPYSDWNVTQATGTPGTTSFTFTFLDASNGAGPPITATTTPLALGDFYVELGVSYDPNQIPGSIYQEAQTPLFYTSATTDNINKDIETGGGTTTPAIGNVPEPASLLQLATGLGLAIYWARRRFRPRR